MSLKLLKKLKIENISKCNYLLFKSIFFLLLFIFSNNIFFVFANTWINLSWDTLTWSTWNKIINEIKEKENKLNFSTWVLLTWISDETNLLNLLDKRKEELKKILQPTEIEQKINWIKERKKYLEAQIKLFDSLNNELKNQLIQLKEEIKKYELKKDEIKKQQEKNEQLNYKLKLLTKKIQEKQKQIELLQKQLEMNKEKISQLLVQLNNYDLILSKTVNLQKELNKKNVNELKNKFIIFSIIIFVEIISLFILTYFLNKLTKKESNRYYFINFLNYLRILITSIIVITFILWFFYFFPKYIFLIFFMIWWLMVSIAPIISNFFSWIFLIWKFKVWDKINLWEELNWIIVDHWLQNLEILKIENWKLTNEIIRFPNRKIITDWYLIEKNFITTKTLFKLLNWKINKENFNVKEYELLEEKIFLNKKLSSKELKEFLYKLEKIFKKFIKKQINDKESILFDFNITKDWLEIIVKYYWEENNKKRLLLKLNELIYEFENKIEED